MEIRNRIKKMPIKGDWYFSCGMQAEQFNSWDKPRDPMKYFDKIADWEALSEDEKFHWLHDDFTSLTGSCHSRAHCSMKLISAEYGEWFNRTIDGSKLYNEMKNIDEENCWELYENEIKKLAERDGITYEGY